MTVLAVGAMLIGGSIVYVVAGAALLALIVVATAVTLTVRVDIYRNSVRVRRLWSDRLFVRPATVGSTAMSSRLFTTGSVLTISPEDGASVWVSLISFSSDNAEKLVEDCRAALEHQRRRKR